jgi:ADP-ribose pyrophosphatase YjhB (NUDIX family)
MKDLRFRRSVAHFLRKVPWLVGGAYLLWRIRQNKFSVGVVGVVLNANREVLLVEHVFHPRTPWGLPGGWLENENPSDAVRRELREELELDVEIASVLLVESVHPFHLDIAFLCHAQNEVGTLSDELLDHRWINGTALPPLPAFHYRAIQLALAQT